LTVCRGQFDLNCISSSWSHYITWTVYETEEVAAAECDVKLWFMKQKNKRIKFVYENYENGGKWAENAVLLGKENKWREIAVDLDNVEIPCFLVQVAKQTAEESKT